jgi:hypothetical protein
MAMTSCHPLFVNTIQFARTFFANSTRIVLLDKTWSTLIDQQFSTETSTTETSTENTRSYDSTCECSIKYEMVSNEDELCSTIREYDTMRSEKDFWRRYNSCKETRTRMQYLVAKINVLALGQALEKAKKQWQQLIDKQFDELSLF